MAKPLRSQLNQVRAWVQQGRTDAWIAHQLEVSASELREFRRRHELDAGEEPAEDTDLRDEIEAEIEAAMSEEAVEEEPVEEEEAEDGGDAGEDEAAGAGDGDGTPTRRRRRRRGGRGRRPRRALQASFDHGTEEGFGLWLDPAVQDDPVYSEHWAGHRPVEVTIEADRIVIRRSGGEADSD
jgi:hypothetical protein